VSVLTAPCHIATLPVAVNICCNSLRSVSIELGRIGSGSDAQAFIGASLGDE
jgi:tartrate dehydratase alpha subunit/fumarate hydratase class I-like protein